MKDNAKIALGSLLNFKRGYDLTHSQMSSGPYPVLGSNGIIGYHNEKKSLAPCLTVGRSGTVGIPHYYNCDCWPHNTCLYVDDYKGNEPLYLYYLLKVLDIASYANSTGVPTLNRNFVHPIKIQGLSKNNSQKSIVNLLYSLDNKIELNNKINAELEAMAKDLYDYWFVQYNFPDENGNPYKSSGGEMVYNEKLKRYIPKNWEVKLVKDFCNVITGKEDANFAKNDGHYAFFTCGDSVLKCPVAAFDGRAVLIAGNGNFNVKYYEGKFNAYQRTYVLIPENEDYVSVIFLAAQNTISKFTKGSSGSIVKFITKGDVENIFILDSKNRTLMSSLNHLFSKIDKNIKENKELEELRDFLLPMLMNGQVKIANNQAQIISIEELYKIRNGLFAKDRYIDSTKIASNLNIGVYKDDLSGCDENAKSHIRYNPENNTFEILAKDPYDNFSIAHEVIHYIKHSNLIKQHGMVARKGEYSLNNAIENEANALAGELILPEYAIKEFLPDNFNPKIDVVTTQLLNRLSNQFRVSQSAIKTRLNVLGYKVK